MAQEVSILLALGAGVLSFLSPCVLPLIPSYLFFLGGIGPDRTPGAAADTRPHAGPAKRFRLTALTASFVLGFSAVFVVLSILLSGTLFLLGGTARYISIASGILIIILGLNVLFDFLKFLNYEKRARFTKRPRGLAGAFLIGTAFGAGWSPCVGPILGSILLMAGQSGKAGQAALYLAAYSLGLGLPFIAAAVFLNRFLRSAAKLRTCLPWIRRISGIFLLGIGLLILLGQYQRLNIFLMKSEYAFSLWAKSGSILVRLIPAILFFLIAALPPALGFLKRRNPRANPQKAGAGETPPCGSWPGIIFSGAFSLLGIVQAAGILDSAGLLARWLLYRQTL
jgi:cytochrome c-type biogenesis protein